MLAEYDKLSDYVKAHFEDEELEKLVDLLGKAIDEATDDHEELEEYAREMSRRRGYGGGWV